MLNEDPKGLRPHELALAQGPLRSPAHNDSNRVIPKVCGLI